MDADALTIIEGALAASDTRVTDVMIPRAQMDVIDVDDPLSEIVPVVIEAAHSRFPVIDGDRDKVLGVLLAKDLLRVQIEPEFNLRYWLRPAVFIPESKRLNVLLREFRVSRITKAAYFLQKCITCNIYTQCTYFAGRARQVGAPAHVNADLRVEIVVGRSRRSTAPSGPTTNPTTRAAG